MQRVHAERGADHQRQLGQSVDEPAARSRSAGRRGNRPGTPRASSSRRTRRRGAPGPPARRQRPGPGHVDHHRDADEREVERPLERAGHQHRERVGPARHVVVEQCKVVPAEQPEERPPEPRIRTAGSGALRQSTRDPATLHARSSAPRRVRVRARFRYSQFHDRRLRSASRRAGEEAADADAGSGSRCCSRCGEVPASPAPWWVSARRAARPATRCGAAGLRRRRGRPGRAPSCRSAARWWSPGRPRGSCVVDAGGPVVLLSGAYRGGRALAALGSRAVVDAGGPVVVLSRPEPWWWIPGRPRESWSRHRRRWSCSRRHSVVDDAAVVVGATVVEVEVGAAVVVGADRRRRRDRCGSGSRRLSGGRRDRRRGATVVEVRSRRRVVDGAATSCSAPRSWMTKRGRGGVAVRHEIDLRALRVGETVGPDGVHGQA